MEVDRIVIDEKTFAKALALFDVDDIKYIDFGRFDIRKSDEDVKEKLDDNVKVKKMGGKKYDTIN